VEITMRYWPIPLILIASLSLPLLAEDWPQFRGPTGQGLSTSTNVPTEWSPTKNVTWKTEIPGHGWSSPVLSAGRLYLTTATGDAANISLRALCIAADTGKIEWNVEVFRPDPGAARAMHQKNSTASATPIITADRLYVHFGHLGTAALDLSGKILWRQTDIKYPPVHGNGGSPILLNNTLIFNCDGARDPFVIALDANTGQIKWKTPRNSPAKRTFAFSTPLAIEIDGATQVVSAASAFVAAYDPADGHEIWRALYDEGYSIVPRPAFAQGVLLVSSAFDSPVLYAIKPAGATGDATSHIAWKLRKGAPSTPSMLIVGDNVFCISDSGTAACADLHTGKVHWTHRLPGNYSASPVFADGHIFFQNEEGVAYVIKADKTFEQLSENDLAERSLASYAVTDGTFYIRTQSHLWKIEKGK
jgi:outer membrane protein assembly factor BamB